MFVCHSCNSKIIGSIYMASDCSFCSSSHRNDYLKMNNSFNNKKIKKTQSINDLKIINNNDYDLIYKNNNSEKKTPELESNNYNIYETYNYFKFTKNRICSDEFFKTFLNLF